MYINFVIVEHFATVYSVLLVANVIAEQSLVIASAICFVVFESFVNEEEESAVVDVSCHRGPLRSDYEPTAF